jgi:hypothetical protein
VDGNGRIGDGNGRTGDISGVEAEMFFSISEKFPKNSLHPVA